MPSYAPQPAPTLNVILTLIDAHAASSRAIGLHWFLRSVSEIGVTLPPGCDTTLLELELEAADTEVKIQTLKLLEMVDANRAWINEAVGPFVTELLGGALPSECEWVPLQDEDFASYWASRLTGLVAQRNDVSELCAALEVQVHVDGALCVLGHRTYCSAALDALEYAIQLRCGEPD